MLLADLSHPLLQRRACQQYRSPSASLALKQTRRIYKFESNLRQHFSLHALQTVLLINQRKSPQRVGQEVLLKARRPPEIDGDRNLQRTDVMPPISRQV